MPVTAYRSHFNAEGRFYRIQPGEMACNDLERTLRDSVLYRRSGSDSPLWTGPYSADVYRWMAKSKMVATQGTLDFQMEAVIALDELAQSEGSATDGATHRAG